MDLGNVFRENFEEELLCRFIVRGKKNERYILCKTESGIRLVPYTVDKELNLNADFENAVFLAEEDIKKVTVVKSDLVYKIKIRLKSGTIYKLTASRKVKLDALHKENVKKLRSIYKKTSRRAQNLERLEIVISLVLAVIIGFHTFIYSFVHFSAKNIDGNELIEYHKSEGQDFMFESLQTYDKTDLKLSGETQKHENELCSVVLPADFKSNWGIDSDEMFDNFVSADERFRMSIDKEVVSIDDEFGTMFAEDFTKYVFKVATYGKCQKYFGIKPDSMYNYEKTAYSLNLNDLDVSDSDMCFVYSMFSVMKSISVSPLAGEIKYIVENEDYCGFIREARLNDNKNCILSFSFYRTEDLNTSYQITFNIRDYTEEDIETAYAIINSLEMK